MKKQASFSWLYIPLSILIFLAFALFIERSGISYTVSRKPLDFLDPITASGQNNQADPQARDVKCLVLEYPESIVDNLSLDTVITTLDSMKVAYHRQDIHAHPEMELESYDTVIITFIEFSRLADASVVLMDWVEDGGNLLFAIRPDNSQTLRDIYPQLGIDYLDQGYIQSDGIEILTPLLPGSKGVKYGLDFMTHTSLPVNLSKTAILHAISADGQGVPIIWETSLGNGSILMINSDQYIDKSSRGLMGAVYSLMQDVVVYPVINAATFHIDDFPAPVPDGLDENIFSQFTRDIKSFYLNVWWPDMQELKEKYNLVYSVFVIETYNFKIDPPFFYDVSQDDVFQYFGGLVLRDGGEVGLHGYNHIPLCMENDNKNQVVEYPGWTSQENMQSAAAELLRFSSSMLSGQPFSAYVPPSNILCDEARAWLPSVFPDLKVIASVYLPSVDVPAYVQEFEEGPDGIIEYPRITAGYDPDNFMVWSQANELWLHYAAGHSVHPDDVLDSYRSGDKTWLEIRETLDEYLLWLYSSMPGARNLTVSEGGMAVQRYARLVPNLDCDARECRLHLDGFYDNAWLMMRTDRTPATISSGKFIKVMENLYLFEATAPDILIRFEVAE